MLLRVNDLVGMWLHIWPGKKVDRASSQKAIQNWQKNNFSALEISQTEDYLYLQTSKDSG